MSIEFHCDHCARLIRAPNEAAGRRGKCPYCQQSVYIPTPAEEIEEIPLAPVDTTEERERERLVRESRQAEREILADKRPPMDRPGPSTTGPAESAMPANISAGDENVEEMVVDYLLLMRNSELVQAESVLEDLRKSKAAAIQVINRLATDAVPPQALAGVPSGVYQGFLKNLRAQLR